MDLEVRQTVADCGDRRPGTHDESGRGSPLPSRRSATNRDIESRFNTPFFFVSANGWC